MCNNFVLATKKKGTVKKNVKNMFYEQVLQESVAEKSFKIDKKRRRKNIPEFLFESIHFWFLLFEKKFFAQKSTPSIVEFTWSLTSSLSHHILFYEFLEHCVYFSVKTRPRAKVLRRSRRPSFPCPTGQQTEFS